MYFDFPKARPMDFVSIRIIQTKGNDDSRYVEGNWPIDRIIPLPEKGAFIVYSSALIASN